MDRPQDDEQYIEPFSKRLEKVINKHDFSQTDLARESGLSDSSITGMKQGDRTRLTSTPVLKCIKGLIRLNEITTSEEVNDWLYSFADETGRKYITAEELGQQGRELIEELKKTSASTTQADEELLLGRIVGREQDIATLVQLVMNGELRLTTLTGAPGVGKTRLAREVEKELQEEHNYQTTYISLAGVQHVSDVLPVLAKGLGVQEVGNVAFLKQRVVAKLEEKYEQSPGTYLLVIDNFEHVIDEKRLIIHLLRQCKPLRILITSRMPLHLREGEQKYPVKPLEVPDATAITSPDDLPLYPATKLFMRYVKAKKPSFSPSNDDARTIAAICHLLSGLPLAIKVVAAQVPTFPTLKELYADLPTAELLTFVDLDTDVERQKTLEATFAWSYDLLPPDQQYLFRHLAVFASILSETPVSEDAIVAVYGETNLSRQEIFDNLDLLFDSGLLEKVQLHRIRGERVILMLRPLYEFALHLLKGDKSEEPKEEYILAKNRHRDFYLDVAEISNLGMRGERQKGVRLLIDAWWNEIQAAFLWSQTKPQDTNALLRFAGRLLWYWFWPYTDSLAQIETNVQTGRAWLYIALARPDIFDNEGHPKDPEAYATALFARGVLDFYTFTQASIAGKSGFLPPADMVSKVNFFEAIAQLFREAKEAMDNVIPNYETAPMEIEDPRKATALMQGMEAMVEYCLGDREWALEALDACLNIFEKSPTTWGTAWTKMQQGYIALGEGYYVVACLLFEESMKLFANAQDEYGAGCMKGTITQVYLFNNLRRNTFFRARQKYAPELLTKRIPVELLSRAMDELEQEEWIKRRKLSREDKSLRAEYESGMSIEDIAAKHHRTPSAIRYRLILTRQMKRGKLTEDEDIHDIMAEAEVENFHRDMIGLRASLFFYFQDMAFDNMKKLSLRKQLWLKMRPKKGE